MRARYTTLSAEKDGKKQQVIGGGQRILVKSYYQ
jgi:hypothetical protein